MMNTDEDKQKLERFNRRLGAYCGGFVGFFFTTLMAILASLPIVAAVIVILSSVLAGGLLGYWFPSIARVTFWISSIFS